MLRALILVLVLANTAYFAWSQGLLRAWGLAPAPQSEPQRVAQQIQPESLRLVAAASAPRGTVPTPAPAPVAVTQCVVAGPFEDAPSLAPLEEALRTSLPTTVWTLERLDEPARWIVYMGRYTDPETLRKKRAELAALKLPVEAVRSAALAPGLVLGAFNTEAAAVSALERLVSKGVRTARVVREYAAGQRQLLRLPTLDPALRPQLDTLAPLLAGQPFRPC
ncbi:MAG: hypothetical protein CVU30_17590 [Betaproteobacteria bacterium HGW-Betaproteobacteria-3]|jgi:cell division protein FtsN|nr:MAG: hypothetical protein CVU30_17590 [Betaproteobacteria bacterium HGW-Betaproteobacteria-3]